MDYARLRAAALKDGEDEEAVTVDTRALIDKVLARYSGEWTTLRELIQNAADAQATTVKVKFETLPSTQVPLPATTNPSDLLKHALTHHTLRRLVVQNNGQPFTKTDWGRLKRIAEGNPDETKIGAFGVGFYSVFADCEEPFVSSGNEAMAFYWKGNALFTRKLQIPPTEASSDTAFVLDYRNTTTPIPNLLSVSQFLATSLTFVALQNIEFWIDDWRILALKKKASPSLDIAIPRDLDTRTQDGFMNLSTADRTSTQIDGTFMNVIGWKPQAASTRQMNEATEAPSLRSFFTRLTSASTSSGLLGKAAKEEKAIQDAISEDLTATSTSSIFLRVTTAKIATKISPSFATELERATKKPPPKVTKIAILTSSYDEAMASEASSSSQAAKVADIFASVLPSKKPGGRIFIGFPTTQTTGAGMHISAPSVIPTVEREAIDLNARWVRTWNIEMLRVAGIMARLAFINEMADLDEKVKRLSAEHSKKKGSTILAAAVEKYIPEALHILKTYTFQDSTPSSKVSSYIEEAFWTSWGRPSIEVYSSGGVLPTGKVRLSSAEVGKFVAGIPVVLDQMKDDPFIRKLIDFDLIKDITVDDICGELAAKALDKEQLRSFIQWASTQAANAELDRPSIQRLLDVTVATVSEGGESGDIIALGSIKYYHSNKIPATLPVPPDTLPHVFSASIPEVRLGALGWTPLGIVPWLRFLIESGPSKGDELNLAKSPKFSLQILAVLSKNWDNLSESSKSSVVSALKHITVMPTKMGLKKPAESFFPTVKLFDDLPILEGCANIKEKFLTALGVRKTVDLETIFSRLLSPTPSAAGAAHAKWSHMELIKYLASVSEDIPLADMKKLRDSPLCPAEDGPKGLEPTKGTTKLYKVSELFEPKDSLRTLGLPILQWPGPPGSFRIGSREGKFLTSLGLRPYPSVPELVEMMASSDISLRASAMTYFISNHHFNNYVSFDLSGTTRPILPIEGNEKQLVPPSACYTNEGAAVLGYNVLRRDLHLHASKFGVKRDPPIVGCVEKLLANPPRERNMAITLFEYFSTRLSDLNGTIIARLKDAPIVPVMRKKDQSLGEKSDTSLVFARPQHVYLGNSTTYGDIFDFVDFGTNANTFLFKCGAKSEPTKYEIAQLACNEPARLLSVLQSPDKYLVLLRTLAEDLPTLKRDRDLYRKMKTSAWLLASRELSSGKGKESDLYEEEEAPIKHYQLAAPRDIVILDDYISYRLFKDSLLCAPEEDSLEEFYMALGSETLGSRVTENVIPGAMMPRQDGAEWLRKHVLERSKIFLHEYSRVKRDAIKRDTRWLEKNLQVLAVTSVSLRRSLHGHGKTHNEKRSAASAQAGNSWILYVAGGDKPDMYQVGQAICQLLLNRPGQQAYFFFEPFLKLGLLQLRDRGYNVDRILRVKAAEARIAEEERRKALEAEQNQIRERNKEWEEQQSRAAEAAREEAKTPERARDRMPGSFHDSPDDEPAALLPPQQQKHKSRGFFSDLTRRFGLDTSNNDDDSESRKRLNDFLPDRPLAGDVKTLPPAGGEQKPKDEGRVTSPAVVQQNLLNAIKSTRAHDSTSLFSPPTQQEVKEKATYCDQNQAHNITFAAEAPHGMRVFVDRNLSVDVPTFLSTNIETIKSFESILRDVGDVYRVPVRSVHIFFDEKGSTIAFNSNGSIFCNLRFFNQLHGQGVGSPKGRTEATTWWWVVLAHELAHNIVQTHNSEHSYYTESFVQQYFPTMMAKAASWSESTAGAGSGSSATVASASVQGRSGAAGGDVSRPLPPPPPYSAEPSGPGGWA
ncbi:heat shock cognate 90 kDa protein [Cladorrhinum sp. PSN259]|nr:heat shock cognate 90 kDa protein [Cladorrhinum sp. PSN259]